MNWIGLDIGTTSVSLAALDAEEGRLLKAVTLANASALPGEPYAALQDPGKIVAICREGLDGLLADYPETARIGLTGQMHGLVYADRTGMAVSPLYTWQDQRGGLPYRDGRTYAEALAAVTGRPVAAGYGLVTHYYHTVTGSIPAGAAAFCTIADYVALRLSGIARPAVHPSMAASMGCFDPAGGDWDHKVIEKAGMDVRFLPSVTGERQVGAYRGIPVFPAFGDNQASFLGAVGNPRKLLVNVGTGSQVSLYADRILDIPELECRPYLSGSYLYVGSSLCGGYAYNLLRDFFAAAAGMMGGEPPADLYDRMNRAAATELDDVHPVCADTRFNGTRRHPEVRGGFYGLCPENFTPAHLCRGVLEGIAGELYDAYKQAGDAAAGVTGMVAAGNGVRKNPVLRTVLERVFGMPLELPAVTEEAACGAARFAGLCKLL